MHGTDLDDLMSELEACGTEQNRKVYPRHGAKPPMFGVSFADLGKLAKRIKQDHKLAQQLWETGNHDARMLACRVAEPGRIGVAEANEMAKACDNYVVAESFAAMLSESPIAEGRARLWRERKDEWVASAGWAITASLAFKGRIEVDEAHERLAEIERDITERPKRSSTPRAITTWFISCRTRALEVAAAISPVDVDHGETSCQTPDAASYIARTVEHRAKQAAKKAAKSAAKGR